MAACARGGAASVRQLLLRRVPWVPLKGSFFMSMIISLLVLAAAMLLLMGIDSLVFRLWARRFATWVPGWPMALLAAAAVFLVMVLGNQTAMRLLQQANAGQKGMPFVQVLPLFAVTLYLLPGLVKAGFLRHLSRRSGPVMRWPSALLTGVLQTMVSVTVTLTLLALLVLTPRLF